jgi:hypothetical protein
MRKIGLLLLLVTVLTSCGNTQEAAPIVDPCAQIRETSKQASVKWTDWKVRIDEIGIIGAKFEVLKWAYIITGDAECFSDELVASAKSAITLLASSEN